jgi:hypothetical protein
MPGLVHITKCHLCDPKKPFTLNEPAFEIDPGALNGQVPERLTQFNMTLLAHIQKGASWEDKVLTKAIKHREKGGPPVDPAQAKHLAAWNEFLARVALAQGTAILSAFETTDPALNQMRETARWKLHEVTRKFFFTDQMIKDALQQLNLDEDDQNNVYQMMIGMRDALLEQGKYAPGQEAAAAAQAVKLA